VARPLDLSTVLELARERHPQLIAKRSQINVAEGEVKQASIHFQKNPEISLRVDRRESPPSSMIDTSLGRGIDFSPSIGRRTGSTSDNMNQNTVLNSLANVGEFGVSVGVDRSSDLNPTRRFNEFEVEISQEFEVFGQPRARKGAALANRDSVTEDVAATEREVLAKVRGEFYAAQIAKAQLGLSEQQLAYANASIELARQQYDAGEISRTDLRLFEIQLADVSTRFASAQSTLVAATNTLRLSVGYTAFEPLDIAPLAPPETGTLYSEEMFVAEVMRTHPRMRHAQAIVDQREREFTLARKDGKPNITGSIFYAEEDENDKLFGVGLSLPLPLFNRNQGSRAASKAAIEVAKHEAHYIASALESEARSAFVRLQSSQEPASLYYSEVLPAIRANLEQLDNAFRQGEIGMLELRVNQRDLSDAQIKAIENMSEYYQARGEAEGLLGHGLDSTGDSFSHQNGEAIHDQE